MSKKQQKQWAQQPKPKLDLNQIERNLENMETWVHHSRSYVATHYALTWRLLGIAATLFQVFMMISLIVLLGGTAWPLWWLVLILATFILALLWPASMAYSWERDDLCRCNKCTGKEEEDLR